jgi:hypothetical protein
LRVTLNKGLKLAHDVALGRDYVLFFKVRRIIVRVQEMDHLIASQRADWNKQLSGSYALDESSERCRRSKLSKVPDLKVGRSERSETCNPLAIALGVSLT